MSVQPKESDTSKMSDKELIAYLMKKNAQLEQHQVTQQFVTSQLKLQKESQLMARQRQSKDEKLKYVQLFAKSGLTKWEFVTQHPEIKRTTLYNWITKYFPNQPSSEGGDTAADEKAEIPKDRLESKDKFEFVIDKAKMNEQEIGAYCRSKGIYSTELKSWKLNCMNANDNNNVVFAEENVKLKAEIRQLKEKLSKLNCKSAKKDKELERMQKALAEYAVKEAFLKKAQALFEESDEER